MIHPLTLEDKQREVWEMMLNEAHNRHFKNEHIPIDSWPKLSELGESVLLGSFSWLGLSSGRRWIKRSSAIPVGAYLSTPSDIARDYIRHKFPVYRRVTTEQYNYFKQRSSHPLYADPQTIQDAVYIDLKAAYWSILRIVGWDVDYNPGKWLGIGQDVSDFPYDGHKLARNCLVSYGLPGNSNVYNTHKGTIVTVKKRNPYINLMLWSLVQDVLHGVARDVIEAGAIYVHTDGYLCHSDRELAVRTAIARWGLVSSVKYTGHCKVYAVGTYDIGSRQHRRSIFHERGFNNVRSLTHHQWLRAKLQRWSERR